MGYFEKKSLKFFKIAKCGRFLVECVSNGTISSKCLSTLVVRFFLARNEKIGKIKKRDDEETVF